MHFVLCGAGKTGSIVAEVARERGHKVTIVEIAENANGAALTRERLAGVDAVIDFTTPQAVVPNIEAVARAGANLVVGTTGWYEQLPHVRRIVEQNKIGLIWGSNFSIGVNVFFQIAKVTGWHSSTATRAPSWSATTCTRRTLPPAPPSRCRGF